MNQALLIADSLLKTAPAQTSLKARSGRHLATGHSNKTSQLTELLGGSGVEASEYDRLYIVTRKEGELLEFYLTRFGN